MLYFYPPWMCISWKVTVQSIIVFFLIAKVEYMSLTQGVEEGM